MLPWLLALSLPLRSRISLWFLVLWCVTHLLFSGNFEPHLFSSLVLWNPKLMCRGVNSCTDYSEPFQSRYVSSLVLNTYRIFLILPFICLSWLLLDQLHWFSALFFHHFSPAIHDFHAIHDTTLMAESEEELKSLLMKVKVESEKVGLKLNILKTKIMASGHFSHVHPVWPHRRQPTRLPRPWDSPGKNTGVDCHFLLHTMLILSFYLIKMICFSVSY